MKEKNNGRQAIRVVVPKRVKKEILEMVKKGEYRSISDFLRHAVYNLLEKQSGDKDDILKEQSLRQFIEKIS